MSTRKELILAELNGVYGESYQNPHLAGVLDFRWNEWAEGDAREDGLQHSVMLEIWNWWPGGGTAEAAAKRIVQVVNA